MKLLILVLLIPTLAFSQEEIVTKSGLRYKVLKAGSGDVAKAGQQVGIYEAMGYMHAAPFYALAKPAPPIKFTLGTKQVIAGVDEAVTGMKVGEVRQLIIPPSLSKREFYPDFLSKDSTLLYKVELVEIYKVK